MNQSIVYYNGKYIPEVEVSLSFRDLGFQRAYGVFDYLRTYNQKPFQSEWHAKQLVTSIQTMNIESDINEKMFLETLETLFEKNNVYINDNQEYGIKTIVTGGVDGQITFLMYMEPLDATAYEKFRETGIGLLVQHAKRQYSEIKNLDYRNMFVAEKELQERNCLEILYIDNGLVYEAGTSNIFMVKDTVIFTPKDNIYKGSTRDFVINLARENGLVVKEQNITESDFFNADEIFITASKKEILPVITIHDNDRIYSFNKGPLTKKLIKLFQTKTQEF